MQLGRLNQRVTIQSQGAGQNSLGEQTGTWSDLVTVWAQAQPLRGREYFASGQMQQVTDVRFRIRYRSDITPSMRVRWRDVLHDIVDVIDVDGSRRMLELMTISKTRDAREDDESAVPSGALELSGAGYIKLGDGYVVLA